MRTRKYRVWDPRHNSWSYFDITAALGHIPTDLRENVRDFTGVQDANGNDIYEGDILRIHAFLNWDDRTGYFYHALVVFLNGAYRAGRPHALAMGFAPVDIYRACIKDKYHPHCEAAVIVGNDTQHPHLL
jgi:hypothetical protein